MEAFTYIGIKLVRDSDLNISINQNNYMSSFADTVLPILRIKDKTSPLSNEEKKLHRNAAGELNWVAGISRPDVSFSVCEASTKFKNATTKDILYINKIIKNVKSKNYGIKLSQLGMDDLILYDLTDGKGNTCPLCQNSSKVKRVVHSAIVAEISSLPGRCDVFTYIDKLLTELLLEHGKQLKVIAYKDNQSL